MATLTPYWNGSAFGTNTGKLNLEFSQQESGLTAKLRFMDDVTGVVEYHLEGTREENGHLILDGTVKNGQQGVDYGNLHIEGDLTADNTIRGSWSTNIGTGGNYILHPFVTPANISSIPPLQIVTKRVYLGFIQIYRDDIDKIVQHIKRDFSIGKIIATYIQEGTEGSTLYEDFINIPNLRRLSYLKLFVSEPEGNGFNRVITIEFRSHGINEIMIQGSQEAWVMGRAAMMDNLMKEFSDIIRDTTVRFSGPLQIILFISFVIIVSTNITMGAKIQWAVATFIVIQVLPWLIQKLFPRAIIVMGEGRTHWLKRLVSKAGTWLFGIFIGLITALITKYGDEGISKIQLIINALFNNPPT